jgi:O-antigen ligase
MEKIKPRIYQLSLFFTLVALALVLVNSGKQREFFYFGVYASIIGLLLENKNITLRPFSIAWPVLLIGLLNLGWYLAFEYHHKGMNFYNEYLDSSKKIILGSFLIFYLERFRSYVSNVTFKKAFLVAVGLGFIAATGYAFWQAMHGAGRVTMTTNRATLSAYLYSVLSLALVYVLFLQERVSAFVLAGVVMLLSYVAILLTGTRAAMGLYFILAVLLTLYHFRKIHIKSAVIFLCIVAALGVISYKPFIKPKVDQTVLEINKFQQGQDRTSLGARFSMWTVGVQNGLVHPFGQSQESRMEWTAAYTKTHPHLAASMMFIKVHLHNEFIEKFSLQGIPGIVLLFFFFAALFIEALNKNNALLLITTLFLFLYGLTDVILLSSEAVLFFLTLFALSTHFSRTPIKQPA